MQSNIHNKNEMKTNQILHEYILRNENYCLLK